MSARTVNARIVLRVGLLVLVAITLVVFSVWTIPHVLFHSFHLHGFGALDATLQSARFALEVVVTVVLAAVLARPCARAPVRPSRSTRSTWASPLPSDGFRPFSASCQALRSRPTASRRIVEACCTPSSNGPPSPSPSCSSPS